MIFILAGVLELLIGLLYLLHPATDPNGIFGYTTYLATASDAGFKRAQKWARNSMFVTGFVEMAVGAGIYLLHWDRFFFVWLLLAFLAFLTPYLYTESKLKPFLKARDEMPVDYIDPDEALKQKSKPHYSKGLRDQFKNH